MIQKENILLAPLHCRLDKAVNQRFDVCQAPYWAAVGPGCDKQALWRSDPCLTAVSALMIKGPVVLPFTDKP